MASSLADGRSGSAGGVLYHYTSAAGLVGILARRCIFAIDVWFLNDAAEVRYAQTKMLERLRGRSDFGADRAWLEELLAFGAVDRAGADDDTLFVTSLCEEPDLLSQWRGYASGGYAIVRDRLFA